MMGGCGCGCGGYDGGDSGGTTIICVPCGNNCCSPGCCMPCCCGGMQGCCHPCCCMPCSPCGYSGGCGGIMAYRIGGGSRRRGSGCCG